MSEAQKVELQDVELGGTRNFVDEVDADMKEENERKLKKELTMEDPFAPRKGKKLTWQNVNMTLIGRKGKEDRKLLTDVWGEVPEKEVTAIMGPSGAGKTSLLNIISGRASSNGNLKVNADVRLNNYEVDPRNVEVRKQIAFVAQDDSLQVTATPREAIRFSAKLRLPRGTQNDEISVLTGRMLEELGLSKCADTIIGGELIKGISGGERKRTSVGVELVVKPALVFLDEPTSGLDSFSAVQLIQVLKKVANAGASVLFTIHQPASEVFNAFDQLILMNKGRVMCQGPASSVPSYFADNGHPIPAHYNPADWIMNIAQTVTEEDLDKDGFFPDDERCLAESLRPAIHEKRDILGRSILPSTKETGTRHVGFLTELRLLFIRELINMKRNKKATVARFMLTIIMSTLIGTIFYDVGNKSDTSLAAFQGHFGAMIMIMMLSMFGTAMPSLLQFPEERPVFLREYSTNHYSVTSYFISRLTMEAVVTFTQVLVQILITYFLVGIQMNFFLFLGIIYTLAMSATASAVFLGSAVEDPKIATHFLPLLFVPQLLFSGFFVATSLIPVWLRWAQYLCALTYAVRLAVIGEFGDCAKEPANENSPDGQNNCARLLDNLDVYEADEWLYWLLLLLLFASFRLLALFLLKKKATKFF